MKINGWLFAPLGALVAPLGLWLAGMPIPWQTWLWVAIAAVLAACGPRIDHLAGRWLEKRDQRHERRRGPRRDRTQRPLHWEDRRTNFGRRHNDSPSNPRRPWPIVYDGENR